MSKLTPGQISTLLNGITTVQQYLDIVANLLAYEPGKLNTIVYRGRARIL